MARREATQVYRAFKADAVGLVTTIAAVTEEFDMTDTDLRAWVKCLKQRRISLRSTRAA